MIMVWIVLASMAAGAAISELYNARMWKRYKEGRREGMQEQQKVRDARGITYIK